MLFKPRVALRMLQIPRICYDLASILNICALLLHNVSDLPVKFKQHFLTHSNIIAVMLVPEEIQHPSSRIVWRPSIDRKDLPIRF